MTKSGLKTDSGEKTTKSLSPVVDWIVRLVKGTIVGIGAILPGLSGGVLAVIFNLYDPLLRFLADLRKNFVKNVLLVKNSAKQLNT